MVFTDAPSQQNENKYWHVTNHNFTIEMCNYRQHCGQQSRRYLIYSEDDFEGRHVAPMGVKFGTEEGTEGPLLRDNAAGNSSRPILL